MLNKTFNISEPSYSVSQFTPTQHATAQDKARFVKQFVRFVTSGFAPDEYPKWFYRRLSMTFGHIAHYNQLGFYEYFFDQGPYMRVQFLEQCVQYGLYGAPTHTFVDAETVIVQWLRANWSELVRLARLSAI